MLTLDITGAILSFIATCLFINTHRSAWSTSLIAVILNGILFYFKGIYADMGLQCLYAGFCVYGWYCWRSDADHKPVLAVTYNFKLTTIALALCLIGLYPLIQGLHLLGSKVAFLDASSTLLSIAAMWLAARKIVSGWVLWLCVDIIYVGLFSMKQLPAHTIVYALYIGCACTGWWSWHRQAHGAKPLQFRWPNFLIALVNRFSTNTL